LAFVLEPRQPVAEWLSDLDVWLARSPNFFASKPVILEMGGVEIGLKEYRDFLGDLTLRHIRVMAVENASRTLVGPHLPPVVTGGRLVDAPSTPEPHAPPADSLKAAKTTNSLIIDAHLRSG